MPHCIKPGCNLVATWRCSNCHHFFCAHHGMQDTETYHPCLNWRRIGVPMEFRMEPIPILSESRTDIARGGGGGGGEGGGGGGGGGGSRDGSIPVLPDKKASALKAIETQIIDYISNTKEEQLSLLEQTVNINSGTGNIPGVHQVGKLFQAELELLGFKTYWTKPPTSIKRAGTLIATRVGAPNVKRLLLINHLDTVFPPTSKFQKFEKHGNIATGPGVADAKGGNVVMLYALKALLAAHVLEHMSITIALVGDEEDSGKPVSVSRDPLVEIVREHDIDVALDFEPTTNFNELRIALQGIASWLLETQGRDGHSSQLFQEAFGSGAIFELARILDAIHTQLSKDKNITFNPGIILGGTKIDFDFEQGSGSVFGKSNIIAKTALAKGGMRFLLPEHRTQAEGKISDILKQSFPVTSATIKFETVFPSMPPTAGNADLLNRYSIISQSLGLGAVVAASPLNSGTGDLAHVASFVSANLSGLGPVGTGFHTAEEKMDITSLNLQTQRAALLLYSFSQIKRLIPSKL